MTLRVKSAYSQAVETLCRATGGSPTVVCAYHGNVDTVHNLETDRLAAIIQREAPDIITEVKYRSVPQTLETKPDVLHAIVACFKSGTGGEWRLNSKQLEEWLEKEFSGLDSLGGTSAIVANHLAGIGFQPVLHTPSRGRRLAALIDSNVRCATRNGLLQFGQVAISSEVDPPHIIVQFFAGAVLRIGRKSITCPHSNRVILGHDNAAALLPIDREFSDWLARGDIPISAGVWCGFNRLDRRIVKTRFHQMESDIRNAMTSNRSAVHHFEASDAREPEVRQCMCDTVLRSRASVGMNEQEIGTLFEHYGITSCPGDGWKEYLRSVSVLAGLLDADTVVVHAEQFVIGTSRTLSIPHLAASLAAGCIVAASRAADGGFVTTNKIRNVLEYFAIRSGRAHQLTVELTRGVYLAVMLPTIDIGPPRYSIGLGDSFVAGLLAQNVRGKNRQRGSISNR